MHQERLRITLTEILSILHGKVFASHRSTHTDTVKHRVKHYFTSVSSEQTEVENKKLNKFLIDMIEYN